MGWGRFFRRASWDAERARELESYIEIETGENLARGLPPQEARDRARRKLGNVTLVREEIYRMNTVPILDALWRKSWSSSTWLPRRSEIAPCALPCTRLESTLLICF